MIKKQKIQHTLKLGPLHQPYESGLIAGGTIITLVSNCADELCIRETGQEGYLVSVKNFCFHLPIYSLDYIEIEVALRKKLFKSLIFDCKVTRYIKNDRSGKDLCKAMIVNDLIANGVLVGMQPT